MYITSPGQGADKYVFGSAEGGGHVCLGRTEALGHVMALAAAARTEQAARQVTQAEAPEVGEDRYYLVSSSLRLLRQVWQGRVTWAKAGAGKFRFTIDDRPAPVGKDLELRWLRDRDYLTTAALSEGDEWAVARTTDFGDEVLAANGADFDKFRDGLPEIAGLRGEMAGVRSLLRVRDEFVSAGRVEWWWHQGEFAGAHGFKTVDHLDPADGALILRDEDPDWMEPMTRLSLDYIDVPYKATAHIVWPDYAGVTLCGRDGEANATYKVAAAPTDPSVVNDTTTLPRQGTLWVTKGRGNNWESCKSPTSTRSGAP